MRLTARILVLLAAACSPLLADWAAEKKGFEEKFRSAEPANRISALTREADQADDKLRRLYKLVEDGLAKMDAVLKERIEALQSAHDMALAALDRAKSATRPSEDVSTMAIDRFAQAMRTRLSTGEIPFRKAYIRSIVDRIEVDDTCVRIMGRKDVLEQAVLAEGRTAPGVHTFVPSWRPVRYGHSPRRSRVHRCRRRQNGCHTRHPAQGGR